MILFFGIMTMIFPYTDTLDWDMMCIRLPQSLTNISQIKEILYSINQQKMLEYIDLNRMKFTLGGVQETLHQRLIEDLK